MDVTIAHLQDAIPVSARLIRAAVVSALDAEGRVGAGEVSVAVVDDARIRDLNHRYRGRDRPTDVLAFPPAPIPGGGAFLGEVVISAERAAEQSREYGHSVEREIALLAIHGVLHLLGYDDATDGGAAQMWERQRAVLARLEAQGAFPAG